MPCNFTLSQSAPVETIQLGDGNGSPLKSVTGPYDATSLHTFISETFPGAVLLEEHQVSTNSLRSQLYCNAVMCVIYYSYNREQ